MIPFSLPQNLVKTNFRCNANPSTNKTPFDHFNFQKADWEKVRLALAESDLEEIVEVCPMLRSVLNPKLYSKLLLDLTEVEIRKNINKSKSKNQSS